MPGEIAAFYMNDLFKIEEPKLLFGYDQKLEDPRDGLTIFGPLEKLRPYGIISGVISTKRGLEKFKVFLKEIEKPLYNRDNVSRPFFPGFNSVFKMEWSGEKIYHTFEEFYEYKLNSKKSAEIAQELIGFEKEVKRNENKKS